MFVEHGHNRQPRATGSHGVRNFKQRIEAWSPATEFWIVVLGAFALPIVGSLWFTANPNRAVTAEELQQLIVQEAIVLAALGWFLSVRNWSLEHFDLCPSWLEIVHGVGLAIGTWVAWTLVEPAFGPSQEAVLVAKTPLDWVTVLAISIINPLFEELFLCGYMITVLTQRQGPGAALAASLAVRLSFHTYQGLTGLVSIGLVGLIFSIYYVRTWRLWPVLVAHGLLDFAALASL
jgi:membrane protease YdiL (CAAX protease family)